MSDVTSVIDGYFAVWNETDPARRRDLIVRTWSDCRKSNREQDRA